MTYFRRDKFSGLSPAVAQRLLADQFGQSAQNIDFESGSIVPIKIDLTLTYNFGTSTGLADGTKHSIYLESRLMQCYGNYICKIAFVVL